ncbi:MAG: hypothetical protein JKY54_17100 [Flavobacteriales bacterium]|nr:hypothetical protein [Flavobacteriales bacterium]
MEIDPTPENMSELSGSTLLYLTSSRLLRAIDLCWRPEGDPQGSFELVVLNLLENIDKKNDFVYDVDWDNPFYEMKSKKRLEIADVLNDLMLTLDPFNDPRILVKRGEVDELSEALRIELITNGLSNELIKKILTIGNWKIQDILIDQPDLDIETLSSIAQKGARKGVKKKALQKLNSKKIRS